MKKLKTGFTLAEVLITLGIIGVVAAITMPAMITSYQYKSVGVKLSKFMAQLENSARPFVVQNTSFANNEDVMSFVNESYLIKELSGSQDNEALKKMLGDTVDSADYPTYYTVTTTELTALPDTRTQSGVVALLKDGTSIVVNMVKPEEYTTHKGIVDSHKVGLPVFNINFDPRQNGLPSTIQKNFNFIVTELGYVYPYDSDTCLWDIYEEDFATNANTFTAGSACNPKSTKPAKPAEPAEPTEPAESGSK